MPIGERIKELRLKQNLKQSDLAEKAQISRVAIGNYERGDRIPNADILQAIAKALDVTVNDLMDFEEKLKKEVTSVEETKNLLNILGYTIKYSNTAGISGISQDDSERKAMELSEHINNDEIPICEIYHDGELIVELTNSQFNNLKESIKYILDYEFYKLKHCLK